jgi:hypothetical protein
VAHHDLQDTVAALLLCLHHWSMTITRPTFQARASLFSNKALFLDDDRYSKTPVSKTTLANPLIGHTPKEMKLSLCGADDSMTTFISDMRYNRVSISPVSHKTKLKKQKEQAKTPPHSATRMIHFPEEERDDVLGSVTKVNSMMPSMTASAKAQTPTNITQGSAEKRDIPAPSHFDTSLTPIGNYDLTPIGNYDEGFWGRQIGFSPQCSSLTPFKSPTMPLSMKKQRAPLGSFSMNTMQTKAPDSLRKPFIRKLVDIKAGPIDWPAANRQRITEAMPTKD